jgi:hypothetical protein
VLGGVSFSTVSTRRFGSIMLGGLCFMKEAEQGLPGFSMEHLVTPLYLLYKYKTPLSVSLDPVDPTDPDGSLYRSVFYPPALANTIYGEKMI